MGCAACSAKVEKILKKTRGVINASVNLATEKATVEYDPDIIGFPAIKTGIEKAGYRVFETAGTYADANDTPKDGSVSATSGKKPFWTLKKNS